MAKLKRYEIDAIMSKVKASLSEKLNKQEQEWADEFKEKNSDYHLLVQLAKNAKEAIDALEAQRKRLVTILKYILIQIIMKLKMI